MLRVQNVANMTRIRSDRFLFFFSLLWAAFSAANAQSSFDLRSPDGRLEVRVRTAHQITYDVLLNGKALLLACPLALDVDHKKLGIDATVVSAKTRTYDHIDEPQVRQKFAKIRENYNEVRVEFKGNFAVTFRAYDEGVAYRFESMFPKQQVKVYGEDVQFNFPGDSIVFYPQEDSMYSHNERKYTPQRLSEIVPAFIASMPAVVDAENVKLAIAESDVEDYPGMWLKGTGHPSLSGAFPAYPLAEKLEGDRDVRVTERADYIASTVGTRTYPWRLVGIAERDADLITNPLVWLLAKPSKVQDASWIRPGKVAWDWWNFNNIDGVDFKAGVNTQTYKYYIDFAAKYGLQYVVLDEGWYTLGNVLDVVPAINMEELTAYAKSKNVGIILWVVWKSLEDQLVPALDQYEKWGVKGVKIDFMQRDDQLLINYYHRVCREAAQRHLLVDFHGGQKQVTMTRTWPNMISGEGVRGMEWSKWSSDSEPQHNVTLPFTRMFLGPMDYTPGAMRNATRTTFAPIFQQPMAMGTRCQQLAMYVVYESPLQMLADSPSNYLREPEAMEFLAAVPTVWDETRGLDGKIAQYVVVARRTGSEWYVGMMSDWTARDLNLDFSFLPEGSYSLDAFQDGVNADRQAADYKRVRLTISRSTKLNIHLAPGGGWAARIRPL
jgi:alpha-glucosidase